MKKFLLISFISFSLSLGFTQENFNKITFVSFPDFFNFDIPEPWHGYDSAVNYFLGCVKSENPDFVLIAGDLVNGHWWNSPKCIEHMGTIYYNNWKRRIDRFNFKYYTAIGDHELGDDPWPEEKIKLIPYFEKIYSKTLNMPHNGPENKKGLAYYVRMNNLLLITVETFEVINDTMRIDVLGEQLEWLKNVLEQNKDAKFKIVQGHCPIWGEPQARSSSKLMIENGKNSEFYKVLKENKVDVYLCGEFHDETVLESDGIHQIVHGSSWGREIVNTLDYLVGSINNDTMTLTLKRIYIDSEGDYMWNLNKDKGPREIVKINPRSIKKGPEITGNIKILKNGNKKYITRTGYFK